MINPIINVMSGATSAYIDSAQHRHAADETDTTFTPHIDVAASSISYSDTFGLGIVAPTGTRRAAARRSSARR